MGCRIPGSFEILFVVHLLDRSKQVPRLCIELLEVLCGKPARAPYKIGRPIVETISIEIDWRVERQTLCCRDERVCYQHSDRSLMLNLIPREAYVDDAVLVHQ